MQSNRKCMTLKWMCQRSDASGGFSLKIVFLAQVKTNCMLWSCDLLSELGVIGYSIMHYFVNVI